MSLSPGEQSLAAESGSATASYCVRRPPYLHYDHVTGILFAGISSAFAVDGDGQFIIPPDGFSFDRRNPVASEVTAVLSHVVNTLPEEKWKGVRENQGSSMEALSDVMQGPHPHTESAMPAGGDHGCDVSVFAVGETCPAIDDDAVSYVLASEVLPDAKIAFRVPKDASQGFDIVVTVGDTARESNTENIVSIERSFFDSLVPRIGSVLSINFRPQLNSLARLKVTDPQVQGVENSVSAASQAALRRHVEWYMIPDDVDADRVTCTGSEWITDRVEVGGTVYSPAPTVSIRIVRNKED